MLHTDDIWAELTRRRIKATDIAIDLGVATSTVTRAINGETRCPAPTILENVADRIGVGVEELLPGRPSRLAQEHSEKNTLGSTSKTRGDRTSNGRKTGAERSNTTPSSDPQALSGRNLRTSNPAQEAA